jgi:hypothetical protein
LRFLFLSFETFFCAFPAFLAALPDVFGGMLIVWLFLLE